MHPLDNPVWTALTTVHQRFAQGDGPVRRYDPAVSVFTALEHRGDEAWHAASALAGGRVFVVFGLDAQVPDGFELLFTGVADQMVAERVDPVEGPPLQVLGPPDEDDMAELVDLAKPGPWERRTYELGTYLGVRDAAGRLIAMAGERVSLPGYTEVSAVSTHPDARRQGLGALVTAAVARGILDRGDTPFLHVLDENVTARRVYEALGFVTRRQAVALVVRAVKR